MSESSRPRNSIIVTPASASSLSGTFTPIPATAPLVLLGDTLLNLTAIGISIDTALKRIPKTTPSERALATTVQISITSTQDLLAGLTQVGATTKACVDDLYRGLQDVQAYLKNRHMYGKRAQIELNLKAFAGRPQSLNPAYQLEIQAAFEAIKVAHQTTTDTLSVAPPVPESSSPEPLPVQRPPEEEPGRGTSAQTGPTEGQKKSTWRTTAVDGLETSLRILSETTAFMPPTAGSIVKLMAGTGLSIIETLKNREQAMELGRHIGTLIQTVGGFLEGSETGTEENDDEQTTARLQSFLNALKVLAESITGFNEQGRLRQGISHKSNKDDLKKWDSTIYRAFVALQTQLSLHSVRILTSLNGADANRERDRLIGLLGDGDTGATEKAADPEDLMCLPGTRTAILGQVDDWIEEPSGSRVFWISGVAGCGKSAIAATIAGRKRDPLTSTAVFHFARANQERNKRVVCSISRQLARFGHGYLEQFVLGAVKANPDIATSHITTQFRQLIIEPLKKFAAGSPPVIIVLDALDEWDNHEAASKLVELIEQADTELTHTVRFVLTSRNEHHLISALEQPSMSSLVTQCQLDSIQKTKTTSDIRSFVEMRLSKICKKLRIDKNAWKRDGSVEKLVELSGGLFQWASTATKYIAIKSSRTRLDEIIRSPKTYAGLDNLYQEVLADSCRDEKRPHIRALIKNVLGSLLVTVTPVGLNTLAYLCCDNIDELQTTTEVIRDEILSSLGSLLIIPKHPDQPITVAHPSVIDFITNSLRCFDTLFHVDVIDHRARLLSACFHAMERDLKQDICQIGDPSKTNEEVQDKVAERIPSGLRYACQYWGTHLIHCGHGASVELCRRLSGFTRKHLLHWLEVMSLIGVMTSVIPVVREVGRWLSDCLSLSPTDATTQRLWSDVDRFVAVFFKPISTAAAHIYISALRLAPNETELARHFSTGVRGLRVLRGSVEERWPAAVWTAVGHQAIVTCVAFSPDGRMIASGSNDKTLRMWDAYSGASKAEPLVGHTEAVTCLMFSPDGRMIASGSNDRTLRLWDADSGASKAEPLVGHTEYVSCLMFSPDGRMIASGSFDKTLRLWDEDSGVSKAEPLVGHTEAVTCLMFSPDGRMIASGSADWTLRLWDADSGASKAEALAGHTKSVSCLRFSPDGRMIASGSYDNTLRLWDADSGASKAEPLVGHTESVSCLMFSPDGRMIASGSEDGTLRLWDADSGASKAEPLVGHTSVVSHLMFSPDGRMIASGSWDKTLRLWDAGSGASKAEPLMGHTHWVTCLMFSPDGSMIASVSYDKTLRLWDTDSGTSKTEPLVGHTAYVSCLRFSPNGNMIASGSYDNTLRLWDADSGVSMAEPLVGHTDYVSCLRFSPDGKMVASGSRDRTLRLWDAASGASKAEPLGTGMCWVTSLSFSADGRTITAMGQFGSSCDFDVADSMSLNSGSTVVVTGGLNRPKAPVFRGNVAGDGWIYYRNVRWLWLPIIAEMVRLPAAEWLVCGTRLAIRTRQEVWIVDVSEVLYIIER